MMVFVVEAGDYEQRYISGIYDSLGSAISGIKETYKEPYIVKWGDYCDGLLVGYFEAVQNYSTTHEAVFRITPFSLKGN
jgi:hypothetical protein